MYLALLSQLSGICVQLFLEGIQAARPHHHLGQPRSSPLLLTIPSRSSSCE